MSSNEDSRLPLPEDGVLQGRQLPSKEASNGNTPLDELSDMQFKYLEGRLNGMQPFAAGRYAGMSEKSLRSHTYQTERHPKVQAAAKFVLSNALGGEVTRETVLEGLRDAVSASATGAELTMAWREIGKLIGAYAPDRTEIVVTDMTHDRLKTVSDKELLGMQGSSNAAPLELTQELEADFEVLREACEEPKEVQRGDEGE